MWLPSAGKGSQGRALGACVGKLGSRNSSLEVWRGGGIALRWEMCTGWQEEAS